MFGSANGSSKLIVLYNVLDIIANLSLSHVEIPDSKNMTLSISSISVSKSCQCDIKNSQYNIAINSDITYESREISEIGDENMSHDDIVSKISKNVDIVSNNRDNHGNSRKRKVDVVNLYLKSAKKKKETS